MIHITDKSTCCGCSACVQRCPKQCISMNEDEEGFLYPIVDSSLCINCGLCEKVCPVTHQSSPKQPQSVYAAINPNEHIRKNSSSGGIFTLLAERIIEMRGIVFGAKFSPTWEIVHGSTETKEGLAPFRGSKYVQSEISKSYIEAQAYLKKGRYVLFSGTPCQIAGLHSFLQKSYDNLFTVDIVCHGVPSPLVWRTYLKKYQTLGTISQISFRDKTTGWEKYSFSIKGDNSSLTECFTQNIYMQGFLKDLYLRPSCYHCPAKSGKSNSDITLADYWGIQDFHPDMDDDKGTSLVLIHSKKGEQLFASLNCKSKKTSYAEALAGNPSITHSVPSPLLRENFWKLYALNGIAAISTVCKLMRPPLHKQMISSVKKTIKGLLKKVLTLTCSYKVK